MKVEVSSVPRIEGHMAIELEIDIEGLRCSEARVKIFEGARLFESVLRHRSWVELPSLASRICGVCGYAHAVCAARAIEDCLGIELGEPCKAARELALTLNTIDSHVLHIALLSLPDLYGKTSALELNRPILKDLIRVRSLAGYVLEKVFGDRVHAKNVVPGGFLSQLQLDSDVLRAVEELEKRHRLFEELASELYEAVSRHELFDSYSTNFVALRARRGRYYLGDGGAIVVSAAFEIHKSVYRRYFIELTVPYSTARKSLLYGRDSFLVGALARIYTSLDALEPESIELARSLNLDKHQTNPLLTTVAQTVEVHSALLALPNLVEEARKCRARVEEPRIRACSGIGVVEAPRGLLYYNVVLDRTGRITMLDIVTPTAHNVADMENALQTLITSYMQRAGLRFPSIGVETIRRLGEVIVRSYDPCVSCSVHVAIVGRAQV